MAQGRSHVELKPEVCWQLPLRREDETAEDGRVTSVVRQWDRRHWGEGGEEFHWWCTEDPDAFVGHEPVYLSMRTELETMAGKKIYKRLAAYLDERTRTAGPGDPAAPSDAAPLTPARRTAGVLPDARRPGYSASGSSSAKESSFGAVPRISS